MRIPALVPLCAVAFACSSTAASPLVPPPCPSGTLCVSLAADATQQKVADTFATAKKGQLILLGDGTFHVSNTLIIAADQVTVRGAGLGKTILDFKGQKAGSEGVFAESVKDLVLESFTVRDTAGNGVKVLGSTGVTFRKLETRWTSDDASTHGPYGLYPVQSKNVLIEDCRAEGASDSGIYLGQSDHAVLRRNEAVGNVAGIEIENTFFADVYENDAHDNTGGILVFDLPGLPQLGGHDVLVHDNKIHSNNTRNFAPAGNIVGVIPRGTGFFVMANSNVEIFHNTFDDNLTAHAAVISYLVTEVPIKDPNYYPYPAKVYLHDNTFGPGGSLPDASKKIGILLATATGSFPNGVVPPMVYDGVEDPKLVGPANPMQICIQTGGAAFVNLHLDKLDANKPDLPGIMSLDATPYDCTLPAIAPITFQGL